MASKFNDEQKRALRFSDVDEEPRRRLPPIKGYEDMPLVSLEEATKSLIQFVPQIKHMVWTVKGDNDAPKNDLTSDELASIKLYSMDWEPSQESFYTILNKTLRAKNRQQLKHWFSYLRLFLTALTKLPSTRLTVFRGVKKDLRAEYPEGSTFIWWGFSSCTASIKVLESDRFLGKKGARTLFTIDCYNGKDIRKHSFYQAEDEILLLPGRQFTVVSCLDSGNGLYMIHLKETEAPFPLLAPVTLPKSSIESKEYFHSTAPLNTKHIEQSSAAKHKTFSTENKPLTHPKVLLISDHLCFDVLDGHDYWLTFTLNTTNRFSTLIFDAVAPGGDIRVTFSPINKKSTYQTYIPVYNLVIGGCCNSSSYIRRTNNSNSTKLVESSAGECLAEKNRCTYWFSFDSRTGWISFGKGSDARLSKALLKWQDPSPLLNLQYVSLSNYNYKINFYNIRILI